MDETEQIKKRRVRYKGTHPRRLEEKYKELNPAKYSEEISKVLNRGQTPAGTHRPICVNEILDFINPIPGQLGLDATLGYGGHSQKLLERLMPKGKLYSIDVDPIELPRTEKRLRDLGFDEHVLTIKRMNFAGVVQLVSEIGVSFDFIIADLGVSSMQIDTPSRGFSYKLHGPLDLRLNPNRGIPASELLYSTDEQTLAQILTENSDEPLANQIAAGIKAVAGRIETTTDLANVIKNILYKHRQGVQKEVIRKTSQRVFQALRIAVNDEFGVLNQFLTLLPACLKSGGRVAILTFHSGEDRLVKKSFQSGFRKGIYSDVAREPVRPSFEEQRANPRSASAKLRWAVRG
ncbi:MAG: 16S rRNA (cytosine(1402)-N(4))-methyltransferase RsmH [Fibrobacter sp.]|nr:16S rRNA (cytosine(1402)-N(4))-methyltransferase RsmH [Fibrobacter sp.]